MTFLISQAVIDLGMKKWFAIVAVGVMREHPASFHRLADLRGFAFGRPGLLGLPGDTIASQR